MSDDRPPVDTSPPGGGTPENVESPRVHDWRPRNLIPPRLGGTRGVPESDLRPARPTGPRRPQENLDGIVASPVAVAGDAILSGEAATSDLSATSSARLGGRAIALAGVVVVAGVVLSRLLGWARTSVFVAEFGVNSSGYDAFNAAFRIPDTIFQLVAAGAVGSALVPVASELLARGEAERAKRLVATIANLMILALIPLVVVAWIAAPALMELIANTHGDGAKMAMEVGLTRMMLLSPVLLAVGAVMTAGLNSVGIFGIPALAPNVYNIGIIVCTLLLVPFFGIYAMAIGVVVGATGLVITQATAVRRSALYTPSLDIHDPAVRETLALMAPRALGLGVTQLVFLVNTFFATSMPGNGPLTIYTVAFTALQVPVGLIGVPLGIVLLPPLSRAVAQGDDERFRRLVDQSLRLLLFVVVPLMGFMIVLATPTIAFLYQHGETTAEQAASIVPVYEVFLLGLVAHVLIALMAPIFYAGKDTRTPVTAAIVAVGIDVAAAIVLFPFLHLEGLALAIGLGAWAEVLLLVALMERRIGFDLRPIARHAVAFAAGACVASAAALLVQRFIERSIAGPASLVGQVTEISLAGLVGLAVYMAWAGVFRLPELGAAFELARTLLRRNGPDRGEASED